MKQCKTCDYRFRPNKDTTECRRYPPSVILTPQMNPLSQKVEMAGISVFPRVDTKTGCGEHKTKIIGT